MANRQYRKRIPAKLRNRFNGLQIYARTLETDGIKAAAELKKKIDPQIDDLFIEMKRRNGLYDDCTTDQLIEALDNVVFETIHPVNASFAASRAASRRRSNKIKILPLFDDFLQYKADVQKSKKPTITSYEVIIKHVLDLLGATYISDITRDSIIKLDKTLNIADITKLSYFRSFIVLIKWIRDDKKISIAHDVIETLETLKKSYRSKTVIQRTEYKLEDIQAIFSNKYCSGYAKYEPYYYIPLVAAATGMRADEIYTVDIKDVSLEYIKDLDRWVILIRVKPNLDGKTKASTRLAFIDDRVPFFSELVNYLSKCRDNNKSQIFKCNFGWMRRRFKEYQQALQVYDSSRSLHSFRHNFMIKLSVARVSSDYREKIMGHSPQGVGNKYYAAKLDTWLDLYRNTTALIDFTEEFKYLPKFGEDIPDKTIKDIAEDIRKDFEEYLEKP